MKKGPLSPANLWLRRFKAARRAGDTDRMRELGRQLPENASLARWWPDGLWSLAARSRDAELAQLALELGHQPGHDTISLAFLPPNVPVPQASVPKESVRSGGAVPEEALGEPVQVDPGQALFFDLLQPRLDAKMGWELWQERFLDAQGAHSWLELEFLPGRWFQALSCAEQQAILPGLLEKAWADGGAYGPCLAWVALAHGADPFVHPTAQIGPTFAERFLIAEAEGTWEDRLERAPAWRVVRAKVQALAMQAALDLSGIASPKPNAPAAAPTNFSRPRL